VPTLLGILITLFFLLASGTKPRVIQQLSNLSFDVLQRQFPRSYNPNIPVRIIDIDNESLARVGQWPWPRVTVAKLNDRLAEAGVAVVAYDVIFAEPDQTSPENIVEILRRNPRAQSDFSEISTLESHDALLAESFARTRVVLGQYLTAEAGSAPPSERSRQGFSLIGDDPKDRIRNYAGATHALPMLEAASTGSGSISIVPDGDNVLRSAPLVARIADRYFPSLSMEALRTAQDAGAYQIKSSTASGELGSRGNGNIDMVSLRVGDFQIPTTPDGQIIMHYTRPHPERYIPAWKIMSDDPADQDWYDKIAGHIVFIGTSAEGLEDLKTTSMRAGEPGVLVHAQIIEQTLSDQFLSRPYWAGNLVAFQILLFGFLLAFLLPRLSAVRGIILILVMGNAVYLSAIYAFTQKQLVLDPVYPLLSIGVSYIVITLTSFYMTEAERSRIRNAFSMYLSPTMVRKVSEDPDLLTLGGEEREITILFLDVRNFSKISESMRPQDITNFLNVFLTPMTNILQGGKATIDKYIGDAIVAFWNAPLDDPDHHKNAARATLKMVATLDDLNAANKDRKDLIWPPDLRIGIGLNSGICCVGNLGSEQRFSYSMIGDAANLASRIEGMTKQYGLSVLIGETTAAPLDGFALLEADIVKVAGREKPERLFILMGEEDTAKTPEFLALRAEHHAFLTAYRSSQWKQALTACAKLEKMGEPYDIHRYYQVMSDRILGYKKSPPPKAWGGVYIATSK